jgi:hypothetical protein
MPKGIREPLQELEGGKGFGGMGGGGGGATRYKISEKPFRDPVKAEQEKLIAGFLGAGAPVAAGLGYAMSEEAPKRRAAAERKEKADREAEAELKRESRGMKKGGAVKGWGKARGARAAKVY